MANFPIPLTTIFTPPPECLASLTSTFNELLLGADTSCLPSGAGTFGNTQTFSPGLFCPSGWTSADGSTVTVGNSVTETRVTCCPGLDHITFSGDTMMYLIESPYAGTFPYCTAWISEYFSVIDEAISTTFETTITDYTSSYTTFYAPAVQLAWQASDKPTKSSSSAPQTSSATASPTASASSSGLSTTTKIIIGVVIPVVVLAVLALVCFCILRRRKTKRKNPTREIQQEIVHDGPVYVMESPMSGKHVSPRVGYASVQQGRGDEYEDQSRSSDLGHTSWGSRTTELPRYAQRNI